MVDNWLIEDIVDGEKEKEPSYYISYSNLLMAVVLWDEVYYPKNNYNWWTTQVDDSFNFLIPYDDEKQEWSFDAYKHIYGNQLSKDEYEWLSNKTINEEDIRISHGAYRYVSLCQKNGLDYLPCLKRQAYLHELNKNITPLVLQEHLNIEKMIIKEINEQIGYLSNKLEIPLLTKYILEKSQHESNPLQYALFLKNEGPLIRYRELLDKIYTAYVSGNYEESTYLIKHSQDTIKKVINIDSKNIFSAKLELIPLLLALFGIKNTTSTLFSTYINSDVGSLFKSNIVFLKELTEFAVSNNFMKGA